MECPNYGKPILRWPYYQDIARAGVTMGYCPWCMQPFRVAHDVPKHQSHIEDWSQRYYPGLTPERHQANNDWFRNMLEMLTATGTLTVPSIQKVFNKLGEEVSENSGL